MMIQNLLSPSFQGYKMQRSIASSFPSLNSFWDHNLEFSRISIIFRIRLGIRNLQQHPISIKTHGLSPYFNPNYTNLASNTSVNLTARFFFSFGSCVSFCEFAKENEYFRQYWVVHNTKYVRTKHSFKPSKTPDLRFKQTGINGKMTLKILHFHACQSSAK